MYLLSLGTDVLSEGFNIFCAKSYRLVLEWERPASHISPPQDDPKMGNFVETFAPPTMREQVYRYQWETHRMWPWWLAVSISCMSSENDLQSCDLYILHKRLACQVKIIIRESGLRCCLSSYTLDTIVHHFGHQSFSVQAPLVWNSLPPHIRHSCTLSKFKTSLQTLSFS